MSTASQKEAAGKAVQQEAETIIGEDKSKHSSAEMIREELKLGHAMRKGVDITGKVLGWAGGIFAVVSTVQIIRNRRRDRQEQAAQAQQQHATPAGGRNR